VLPSKKHKINTAMHVEKLVPFANGARTFSMWRMICMYCRMFCAAVQEAQGKREPWQRLRDWDKLAPFANGDLIILKHYVCKHRDTSEI